MDNLPREPNKTAVILLALFSCAFLLAAGAALLTTIHWQPMLSASRTPPNGTTGSAQPGTIGLARPHAPLPAQ